MTDMMINKGEPKKVKTEKVAQKAKGTGTAPAANKSLATGMSSCKQSQM